MPEVDIATWADTLAQLSVLRTFRLDIVMSVDRNMKSIGKELSYLYLIAERCRALADNVEKRLRGDLDDRGRGDLDMTVRWRGTCERVCFGRPW
jgi:hypothetical protein